VGKLVAFCFLTGFTRLTGLIIHHLNQITAFANATQNQFHLRELECHLRKYEYRLRELECHLRKYECHL
jgi:hypothetical protein